LNQRVGKFIPHKQLDKRYLFHILSSKTLYLYYLAGGGAQPNLSSNKLLNDFVIPIPPLEEQKRIVSILDRFEALTTDLQSGLPAEIEARRKQYEYYREQLLTFKRKTA
jgi:type I restriction enzyme S subunit